MESEKRLEEGYREMANDTEHEPEAAEWCDALIGDSPDSTKASFRRLDELNASLFPPRCQPAAPKRDVFK
jgi:hypothetical protein